jgi:nucleotide-binding universal stress UspA family protein
VAPGAVEEVGMMERSDLAGLVLVGVDGSDAGLAALDWAIGEAQGRHARLRIVHAFAWPLFKQAKLGPSPFGPAQGGLRAEAERVLDEAVRRACAEAPGVAVEGRTRVGLPPAVLLAESADADLVVVGSRGLGGFTGLLVGSVSAQVAEHARRPVVVTRPPVLDPGQRYSHERVVVGVNGSADSGDAVAFAVEEAVRLGTGLTAVDCLERRGAADLRGTGRGRSDDEAAAAERTALADMLAGWVEKYPQLDVLPLVLAGPPAETLVRASHGARLLVVGSRGIGGFRGMLLGSVSHALLRHAACPLAVVHPDR